MKPDNYFRMTDPELVEHFVKTALAQDDALLNDRIGLVNKLVERMKAVVEELKFRPGDRRRALIDLYRHPNAQVRLMAATHTLAVAPDEARGVLQAIVDRKQFPQAGEAGMRLRNLDSGFYKPT